MKKGLRTTESSEDSSPLLTIFIPDWFKQPLKTIRL